MQVTLGPSAGLSGSGSLTTTVVLGYSAALSGSGSLTTQVTLGYSAALSGSGSITGLVTLGPSAALSGTGTLQGLAILSVAGLSALTGQGVLIATAAHASSGNTGTVAWLAFAALPRWETLPELERWAAGPEPGRWGTIVAPSRWSAIMTMFRPIAAISLEEINVTWTSELGGTRIDPTGQTPGQPQLVVEFAFPVSSGNQLAPAEPVTWYTGQWLVGTTSLGYIAQCLIGPGGGQVTLAAGQSYDVWSKILGSPEVPAKFAGTQQVY
jgi:hypothetical protein